MAARIVWPMLRGVKADALALSHRILRFDRPPSAHGWWARFKRNSGHPFSQLVTTTTRYRLYRGSTASRSCGARSSFGERIGFAIGHLIPISGSLQRMLRSDFAS